MNENEILEVEMTLGGGQKVNMNIQQCDDWSEIQKGTKALLVLRNSQQMLVEINEACEDEGVSFKIIGDERSYHYEAIIVYQIFVEVDEPST